MKRKTGKFAGKRTSKFVVLLSSLLLLAGIAAGATLAFLVTGSDDVVNTFTPSVVDILISEEFDGETKSNVKVKNLLANGKGTKAFIRVRVVDNWVDATGNVLPEIPTGDDYSSPEIEYADSGWTEIDGFYYFNGIVEPNAETDVLITKATYSRPAGATERRQIDILAEAIQADPLGAVMETWGVTFYGKSWVKVPTGEGG